MKYDWTTFAQVLQRLDEGPANMTRAVLLDCGKFTDSV